MTNPVNPINFDGIIFTENPMKTINTAALPPFLSDVPKIFFAVCQPGIRPSSNRLPPIGAQ
jgi:hypothetical protein